MAGEIDLFGGGGPPEDVIPDNKLAPGGVVELRPPPNVIDLNPPPKVTPSPTDRQLSPATATPLPGTEAAAALLPPGPRKVPPIHPATQLVLDNFDLTKDMVPTEVANNRAISQAAGVPLEVVENFHPSMVKLWLERQDVVFFLAKATETRKRLAVDAEAALLVKGSIRPLAASEQALKSLGLEIRAPFINYMVPNQSAYYLSKIEKGKTDIPTGIRQAIGTSFEMMFKTVPTAAERAVLLDQIKDVDRTHLELIGDWWTRSAMGRSKAVSPGSLVPLLPGDLFDLGRRLVARMTGDPEDTDAMRKDALRLSLELVKLFRARSNRGSDYAKNFWERIRQLDPKMSEGDKALALAHISGDMPGEAAVAVIEVIAQQAVSLGAGVAATWLTKRPIAGMGAALTGGYVQERFGNYNKDLIKKYGKGADLNTEAGMNAFIDSTERQDFVRNLGETRALVITVAGLLGFKVARVRLAQSAIGNWIVQTPLQVAQEGIGEAAAAWGAGQDFDAIEVAMEMAAGAGMTPMDIFIATGGALKNAGEAKTALKWLETGKEIAGHTKDIELHARATAAEIMADRLKDEGVTTVHLSGEEVKKFDQSLPEGDTVAATLGLTEDQVNQAAQDGRDIEIGVDAYVRHILGKEGFDALIKHTRFSLEGMTPAEAAEFDATGAASIDELLTTSVQDRLERALGVTVEETDALRADAEVIHAEVKSMLDGMDNLSNREAELNALLMTRRYVARAARATKETGQPVSALELFRRDNLRITNQDTSVQQLADDAGVRRFVDQGQARGQEAKQPELAVHSPEYIARQRELSMARDARKKEASEARERRDVALIDEGLPADGPEATAILDALDAANAAVLEAEADLDAHAETSGSDSAAQQALEQDAVPKQKTQAQRIEAIKKLRGIAKGTKHGVLPHLRSLAAKKPKTTKPQILLKTTNKNAQKQLDAIDVILENHPDAHTSAEAWSAMMAEAYGTRDVPMSPFRFIEDINGDGAVENLSRLSEGQVEDADHGFQNAADFREAYTSGELGVDTTGKLFLWSFLSRGVNPYTQEGMFIDAFDGIEPWFEAAAAGEFDVDAYAEWTKSAAPKGSGQPGAGATHNLNSFGRDFLVRMSQDSGDGRSRLQLLHDLMSDPDMTGQEIRRQFATFGESVGIDNKVMSFTLLVAGFNDVMVLDRVQFRQLYDDGRFQGINLYDGMKKDGKVVTGTSFANQGDGARGILIYEAMERAIAARIDEIYSALGREGEGSVGRYHWETWVSDSQQEASHGTLGAILPDALGDKTAIQQVTAKQGEYGSYAYGARYGVDGAGNGYFLYSSGSDTVHIFTVDQFVEFQTELKKPANGVMPTGFKVTESGNAPWHQRDEIDSEALETLASKIAEGEAGQEQGTVRRDGKDQALPDRSTAAHARQPLSLEQAAFQQSLSQPLDEDGIIQVVSDHGTNILDTEINKTGVSVVKTVDRFGNAKKVRKTFKEGTTTQELLEWLGVDPSTAIAPEGAAGPVSLEQAARGSFTPSSQITDQDGNPMSLIQIFERGDRSTFLHESGHFWLEQLASDAKEFRGEFQKDWGTVKKWWTQNTDSIRVEAIDRAKRDGDTVSADAISNMSDAALKRYINSDNLTGEGLTRYISVAMHEQFARGTENYFRTGEAPSIALADAFVAFGAWIRSVYRTIQRLTGREGFDVQFSPEVTALMDRMLATDMEIEVAASQYALTSLFETAEQAGMTKEKFAEHQRDTAQAKEKAKAKHLAKRVREMERERLDWWKEEREKLRPETAHDVARAPAFRVIHALAGEGLADGSPLTASEDVDRMDMKMLRNMGVDVNALPRVGGRTIYQAGSKKNPTSSPGLVANLFGYEDVNQMIEDLNAQPTYAEAVELELDARMKQLHGSIDDGAIDVAIASIHEEDSISKQLFAELAALRTSEAAINPKFVRAYAEDLINQQKMGDANPRAYLAAEKRHARAAGVALRKGDRTGAYKQQFQRLVNHYLAAEATKQKSATDKMLTYMRRFKSKRRKFGGIEADFIDQIRAKVNMHDFAARVSDRRRMEIEQEAFSTFIANKLATGEAVFDIPQWLQDKDRLVHWRDLTVGEFRTLHDTIKQLEKQGRNAKKLRVGQEDVDRESVVAQMRSALAGAGVARAVKEEGKQAGGAKAGAAQVLAFFDSHLTKIEFLLEQLDGQPLGVWHQSLYQPFADAETLKQDLNAEVANLMRRHIDALPKRIKQAMGKRVDVGELAGTSNNPNEIWSRGNLIMLALNVGNASNLDKVIRGETSIGRNIDEGIIDAALKQLSKEEWDFVRAIWGHAEKLWPTVEKIYRDEYGRAPERVTPREVHTDHGSFEGGYFPLMYNTRRSAGGKNIENMDSLEAFTSTQVRATVNSSMTKERVQEFTAPIDFDIQKMVRSFDRTIHFMTHYAAVKNANRILNHPELRADMMSTLGPQYVNSLTNWVGSIAANGQDAPATGMVDITTSWLARNTTVAVLGASYSTLLAQILGYTTAIDRLMADTGTYGVNLPEVVKDLGIAWGQVFSEEHRKAVFKMSGEMRHRLANTDRDLRAGLRDVQNEVGLRARIAEYSMLAIAGVQLYTVDFPVWVAAYNRSLRREGNVDIAIKYADRVVRQSQSAGGLKDLAAVQRGKGAAKLVTMFYSFFSVMYAILRSIGRETTLKNPGSIPRMLARLTVVLVINELCYGLLRGEVPDLDPEDEDEEGALKWLAKKTLSGAAGTVPFGRDIVEGAIGEYGYDMSPTSMFGESVANSVETAANALDFYFNSNTAEEPPQLKDIKPVVLALSIALKVPGIQANRTMSGLFANLEGAEDADFFDLLTGYKPPKK